MKTLKVLFTMSLIVTIAFVRAQTNSGRRLKGDVYFLADDLLQGRQTPGEGLNLAALYLANQLEAYGLKPANAGSYYQNVTLETFIPGESKYRIDSYGLLLWIQP
jgi:hypothetical protein